MLPDRMRREILGMSENGVVTPAQQPEPICIAAPVVSGTGSDEVLERVVIDLPALLAEVSAASVLLSGATTVVEVVVLSKRVIPQRVTVMTNKVLIDAILHKDLLFKVLADVNAASSIITGDCTATVAETFDLVLDCPVGICVPVPGACPGDIAQVRFCIEAEQENLIAPTLGATPTQFEEKVCVRADVVTLRPTNITVTPTEPSVCPTLPDPTNTCPTPACPTSVGLPTSVVITSTPGIIPGSNGFFTIG